MDVYTFSDIKDGEAFDFVVAGSGFGGSVCALRLADKGYSVAVLEARLRWSRGLFARVTDDPEPSSAPVPFSIPAATETLRRFSAKVGGVPHTTILEAFFNMSTTAHILGGAVMAAAPEEGIVDLYGKVFGYPNLCGYWTVRSSPPICESTPR